MEVATSSRYAIQSLLLVACLTCFAWRRLDLRGWRGTPTASLAAVTCGLAALSTFAPHPLLEWRTRVVDYDRAGFAFGFGIVDTEATGGVYPFADLIRPSLAFLAAHRLGPFSTSLGAVYRPPTNALGGAAVDSLALCRGSIDTRRELAGEQAWLTGWAAPADGEPDRDLLIAFDASGREIGAASASIERPDVAAVMGLRSDAVGFGIGLRAPAAGNAAGLSRLVLVPGGHGAACRLPS